MVSEQFPGTSSTVYASVFSLSKLRRLIVQTQLADLEQHPQEGYVKAKENPEHPAIDHS
jgi:hypothetical protein